VQQCGSKGEANELMKVVLECGLEEEKEKLVKLSSKIATMKKIKTKKREKEREKNCNTIDVQDVAQTFVENLYCIE